MFGLLWSLLGFPLLRASFGVPVASFGFVLVFFKHLSVLPFGFPQASLRLSEVFENFLVSFWYFLNFLEFPEASLCSSGPLWVSLCLFGFIGAAEETII